jgi:hypothetical protein
MSRLYPTICRKSNPNWRLLASQSQFLLTSRGSVHACRSPAFQIWVGHSDSVRCREQLGRSNPVANMGVAELGQVPKTVAKQLNVESVWSTKLETGGDKDRNCCQLAGVDEPKSQSGEGHV